MSLDILDPVSFLTGIFDAEKGAGKNDPFQQPFFGKISNDALSTLGMSIHASA